jgi:putative ABC transport system permease protein
MARRRQDRWLLLRVAAQNVGRRQLRAIFLGIAVMLGVGVGFASFVAGWALRSGIATSFSRMGADLVVVPRAALVNITSSLLTVQPTDETLDAGMATSLAAIAGVARVAPQRIVPSQVDGRSVDLIAFDPAYDFSILTWLEDHQLGPLTADSLIAGGRVAGRLGESLSVCGRPLGVYGRLDKTGVGPFDESYFISFEGLGDIVAFCRSSRVQRSANGVDVQPAPGAIADFDHADGKTCAADLPLDRVSAFLLQLSPGTRVGDVKFAIAQLPDVRVVEGNTVLTSSRQAMSSLLIGVAVFTVFQLTALLIVVSLLFSAIVQERYREVGLLRAMGARPKQVMAIILGEAAIITGLGGLAGLVFGATLLLIFARSLGFYFGLLGVPFSWPPLAILETGAAVAVAFSAILGLVGAFVPAWRVRQLAPHALIQAEVR